MKTLEWKTEWTRSATCGETTYTVEHQVAISGRKEVRRTLLNGRPQGRWFADDDSTEKTLQSWANEKEHRRLENNDRKKKLSAWEVMTGLTAGPEAYEGLRSVEIEPNSSYDPTKCLFTIQGQFVSVETAKKILDLLRAG